MGGAGPLVEEYDRMCLLGDSLSLEDRSAALGGVPRLLWPSTPFGHDRGRSPRKARRITGHGPRPSVLRSLTVPDPETTAR